MKNELKEACSLPFPEAAPAPVEVLFEAFPVAVLFEALPAAADVEVALAALAAAVDEEAPF